MSRTSRKNERFALGGAPLTLETFEEICLGFRKLALAPKARAGMKRSYEFLRKESKRVAPVYGVNTGFGLLSDVRIPDSDLQKLQLNLLRSHAVGTGPALSDDIVRGMVTLRAQTLALGYSGVRPELVEKLIELLNHDVLPIIPEQGSVGASGDLAPLAHLALVLVGEGEAKYRGKLFSGKEALRRAKIRPIVLGPKEGLALINGTQFMAAWGALTLLRAERLAALADAAGALSLEACRGTADAFSPEIHRVRPHPGQSISAANLRRLLTPLTPSEIALSHQDCGKVQDPYSFRCMPQVHGAIRETLGFARSVFEREINSVTDNPLVFPQTRRVLSGGNFHGQILSMSLDYIGIALAELASISHERLCKLINPAFSGLPAFLVADSGLNSGFMIVQVAAASIVSENKTLAHPASVDSIPTSADKEDHVSMGAWAAVKAARILQNAERVLGMELLAAAQGIDLLRPLKTTAPLERLYRSVRKHSKGFKEDRVFSKDIESVSRAIRAGQIS